MLLDMSSALVASFRPNWQIAIDYAHGQPQHTHGIARLLVFIVRQRDAINARGALVNAVRNEGTAIASQIADN